MFGNKYYNDDDMYDDNMMEYDIDDDLENMKIHNISYAIVCLYIVGLLFIITICFFFYFFLDKKNKTKIINNNIEINIKRRGNINTYKSIQSINPEICTICYDNYSESDEIFTFYCGDSYHHKCIKQLFKQTSLDVKCPYCQQVITVEKLKV